jgi:hypothetical protein
MLIIIIIKQVTVGSQLINPVSFRKNIAYVMQEDALLATATPREALTFSAKMRLPTTVTIEEIGVLVNNLLEELGLGECADGFIIINFIIIIIIIIICLFLIQLFVFFYLNFFIFNHYLYTIYYTYSA